MAQLNIALAISGVDQGASSLLSTIQNGMGGLGSLASGALTVGLGAATAGIGALFGGLALAANEAMGAQEVMAQTEAVIKSTGGAAGMTAAAVADLATALSTQSRFADDAVQKGENLLLTFTNIGVDVFPDATQAMVDMATAMETDVSSGAIQLGKALNDPTTGITALTRVGVTFTEEQKDLIKSLQETGDTAGAQRIILAELNKEFGGSAAASAETFGGRLDVMKNKLLNVAEAIGGPLLTVGAQLLDEFITPNIPLIEEMGSVLAENLGPAIDFVIGLIRDVVGQGGDMGVMFDDLNETFGGLQPTFGSIEDGILAVQRAFGDSLPMIQGTVAGMVSFIQNLFAQLSPTLIANVSSMLQSIAQFWTAHGAQIMAVLDVTFKVVVTTIGGALTLVSGILAAAMKLINGDWSGAWKTIQDTATTFINAALGIVGTNLTDFQAVWKSNWDMFVTIVTVVWENIKKAIGDAVGNVMRAIQPVLDAISNIRNFIAGGIPHIPSIPLPSDAQGHALGADFIVPPGFPNDSFPMRVQSGEHVTVTPAGQSSAAAGNLTINVDARGSSLSAAQIKATVRQALAEAGYRADGRMRLGVT